MRCLNICNGVNVLSLVSSGVFPFGTPFLWGGGGGGGGVMACIPACYVVLLICVSVGRGCSPIADGGHLGPEFFLIIKASYLFPVWCGKFLITLLCYWFAGTCVQ